MEASSLSIYRADRLGVAGFASYQLHGKPGAIYPRLLLFANLSEPLIERPVCLNVEYT